KILTQLSALQIKDANNKWARVPRRNRNHSLPRYWVRSDQAKLQVIRCNCSDSGDVTSEKQAIVDHDSKTILVRHAWNGRQVIVSQLCARVRGDRGQRNPRATIPGPPPNCRCICC